MCLWLQFDYCLTKDLHGQEKLVCSNIVHMPVVSFGLWLCDWAN